MILADTSIIIDWLRLPSLLTRRIIGSHDPAICGVSLTELLVGIRTEPERTRLGHQLAVFGCVRIEEPVWEIAGRTGAALEAKGARIPFPDMLIVATAIHHNLPLWTRDKHFARVQDGAPELVLFDESTA
jgi:predicted nucleic acid-binding protein